MTRSRQRSDTSAGAYSIKVALLLFLGQKSVRDRVVSDGGATAHVTCVAENVSADIAKAFHFKLDQPAPVDTVRELAN